MKGPVLLLVAASAVLALLAFAAWMRHRALVASPGVFDAVFVGDDDRRRRVVGRYGEDRLSLAPRWLPERPCWSARRWDLDITRRPAEVAERSRLEIGGAGSAADAVVALEVDDAVAGAVRAWAEAGPSQAGHAWWHPPGQA